ncbi:hypothetical protein [Kangiella sp. TOML190]|uniref:hypothetical protein n=1 Tax=Kangiella sp. TOML190 TaxID=2931351 RepID=UPI002040D302|nr:hypothetical protein [Kangiella sp. TOML190]
MENTKVTFKSSKRSLRLKTFLLIGLLSLLIPNLIRAESLRVKNSRLEVSFSGSFNQEQRQMLLGWIKEMATSVTDIYGEFPLDRAKVKLVRSYSWREPVPWGEVQRWQQSQVVLHVNPEFGYQRVRGDWTAVHEMSHLLLPYAGERGRWLSEGLASYYQNIARGNSGLLSEKETWQKLFHGFRRGERSSKRYPQPLSKVTRRRGSTMRIYWSGAAYFLKVDLALRQASNGNQSLPTVLKQYKDCCLPNHRPTSALSIVSKLDELSGTGIFSKEYEQIIHSKVFPDYRSAFEDLGIKLGWGGVSFTVDPTKEQLRRAIVKSD